MVSPYPDLAVRPITVDDSCIVLVSDGVTNVLNSHQVNCACIEFLTNFRLFNT